jgi:D-aminopeptidase
VADGSVIVVVATDAPMDARSMVGLVWTESAGSNGSGDYAIAFSAAEEVRIRAAAPAKPPSPRAR